MAALSPVRGGELVRIALVRGRIDGATYSALAATLVVESIVDAAVAASLCLGALTAGLVPGVGGLAVVALCRERLARFWARLRLGFAVLGDRERLVRSVLSWLALSWMLRLASVYWFLEAFSIDASLGLAASVVAAQCVSTLVPLTSAGIGAQHGLLVAVLAGVAGSGSAVAFGLGMQAATLLFNVGSGVIALALVARTVRWRRLCRAYP